jgi:phosphoribosylformylglycinamidine synthase
MKFGVVVFPGSNCDHDCFHALKHVLKKTTEFIWHKSTDISGFDCLILPGGFSYGDYLRTGAIAHLSPVMKAVKKFARGGGLVIGVCNGFQILLEAGLLPGTMMRNTSLHFICKYTNIICRNQTTPFTNTINQNQILKIPIAHNEGNYYADEKTLKELVKNNQIVFQYCSPTGGVSQKFNPNGSRMNIAGIINKEGNVLGMMPHPERAMEKLLGSDDGVGIFLSIINHLSGEEIEKTGKRN